MIENQHAIVRSKLFVPASQPALFPKALASQTDAICFDLEDSVLPDNKAVARNNLRGFLSSGVRPRQHFMVRVNPARSSAFEEDMSAVVCSAVSTVVLPKVEDPADIREAAAILSALERQADLQHRIGIVFIVESPRGLRLAEQIAAADGRVAGLQLGLADFFEPLGIERNDTFATHQIRLQVRLAAGEAGIPCYDSAFIDFNDDDGFNRDAAMARALGFAGKSCIHPRQIALANQIFSPYAEEIAASLRIVDAAHKASMSGKGAFVLDGQMIDKPFVKRAEAVLQLAQNIKQLDRNESGT